MDRSELGDDAGADARGDTTIASLQYSFLPSWIAFLVDEPVAAEAGAALFDAVYRRWAELPEDTRPQLIVYGLSLGSFGAEAGFAGTLADSSIANLQARTDGVLLAGPTHDNPVRQQIAEDRERGSPAGDRCSKTGRSCVGSTAQASSPSSTPAG